MNNLSSFVSGDLLVMFLEKFFGDLREERVTQNVFDDLVFGNQKNSPPPKFDEGFFLSRLKIFSFSCKR